MLLFINTIQVQGIFIHSHFPAITGNEELLLFHKHLDVNLCWARALKWHSDSLHSYGTNVSRYLRLFSSRQFYLRYLPLHSHRLFPIPAD